MNPILQHIVGNWKSSVQGLLTVGIALGTYFTVTPSNVLPQHTVAWITLATGAAKVVLAFFENDAKPAVTSSITVETTAPTIAKILILVALLGASSASAQNAKVIVLSAEDANKAAALYAQRDAIQKQINELEKALKAKHLTVNGQPKDGWFSGFQFSEDFKAIVPVSVPWTSLTSSTPIVAPFTPSCWNVSPSSTLCGGSGCPYSAPMYGPVYGINNNPIGISTIN